MYPRLVVGCALFLLFIRWNLELWLDGWYFLVLSICIPQKLILHNPQNLKLQTVGECYAVTVLVHSICCWNNHSNQVICFFSFVDSGQSPYGILLARTISFCETIETKPDPNFQCLLPLLSSPLFNPIIVQKSNHKTRLSFIFKWL